MSKAALTRDDVEAIFSERIGKAVSEIREMYSLPAKTRRAADLGRVMATENGQGQSAIDADEPRGKAFARTLRAFACAGGDPAKAARIVRDDYAKSAHADKAVDEAIIKSLEATEGTAGGFLLESPVMGEIEPLLRATSVVRASGPRSVPMPAGSLGVPSVTGASTAYWVGEMERITPSQPSFGRMKLTAKKLAVLVAISNDWLRYGDPAFDALVRDDMILSAALEEDVTMIRSVGSENKPKGLRYLADPDNVVAASDDGGATTSDTVTSDLIDCVDRLETANVTMRRPGWLMHPRTKNFLCKFRGADGAFLFKDELQRGELLGFPVKLSTQIPINLGGGSDESEIYFVDWSYIMIGDTVRAELKMMDGAAYAEAGGTVRAAFSTDESVVRLILEMDLLARQRGREITIINAAAWTGAPG